MGGDFGPSITVPASIQALLSNDKMKIFLVGDPKKILISLEGIDLNLKKRFHIIPSQTVIKDNISLSNLVRHSYGSSMRIALELVKSGKANACISAGNTALLMALSKILIKPLDNIKRPALMTILPNIKNKKKLILDLGANINCNTQNLVQFALMGSILANKILNIKYPKISLLNIGKETNKGLDSIQNAAKILKKCSKINYIGYTEADKLLNGYFDVLVCDGFVGNVMLKTMEGSIKIFFLLFQSLIKRKWCLKIIMYFFDKYLLKYFYFLNPDEYNGACLLGLKSIVIKSHGSANQNAFFVAIKQAEKIVMHKIPELISKKIITILPKE